MPIESSCTSCGPPLLSSEQSLAISRAQDIQQNSINANENSSENNRVLDNDRVVNNGRVEFNANALAELDREYEGRQQTQYDNPPATTSKAIQAYQTVSNNERKDSLQQLLGVDVFV